MLVPEIPSRRVDSHPNLQARDGFSFMLWFKSNGVVADYAQILSKREGVLSPYFIQVEQGGAHVKTLFRFSSSYTDNGAFEFDQFKWHFLATTFDGERLKTYFDGVLSGSVFKPDPVYVENGDLGIGGCPDGSNLFKGWIDDVRIYKTTLSQNDIDIAYGDGFGDFGPIGDFSVNSSSSISPIPVTLTFRDSFGNPVNVSDLDPNDNNGTKDIDLVGGTITNFIVDNNSTYRFDLVPDRKPQRLFLKLNSGAAVDINGDFSQKNSVVITYNDKVTRSANLVGWWSFDEANGTLVPDQSGGDAFAKLIGGAGISNSNPKFGTGALLLDGSDSWAEVGALMAPTKTTREDDLIGWWKFDEASGTDAINSVNGSSDASLVDNAAFSIIEKSLVVPLCICQPTLAMPG